VNTGIILQARTGSTRLPGKILKPFYKEDTILDIIIKQFKDNSFGFPVTLATSINEKDACLEDYARKHEVLFFRGSENNVLQRFIDAAEANGFSNIVRVCADNPFLNMEGFETLAKAFANVPDLDYLSFKNHKDKPAIKTHWGLFTEFVSLNALKKVDSLTQDPLYLEHVTNYIYEHPEDNFKIKLLEAPDPVYRREDIRFTIDTLEDFELLKKQYSDYLKSYSIFALENLVDFVDGRPEVLKSMKINIKTNSK